MTPEEKIAWYKDVATKINKLIGQYGETRLIIIAGDDILKLDFKETSVLWDITEDILK